MLYKAILIVDDDADIRLSMKLALDAEGYKVFEAENGQQALDLLINSKEFKPQDLGCIILDLMMPKMGGKELINQFKTNYPQFLTIPILLSTARGSPVKPDDTVSEKDVAVSIQKPMNLDELYRVVALFCKV